MAAMNGGHAPAYANASDNYFGTRIQAVSFSDWLAGISRVLGSGKRRWLCGHHNLHSLYQLQTNSDVRAFYARCQQCYIDGVPVRLLLAGFGIQAGAEQRFSLMDHFVDLLRHAQQQGWSIFYLGSSEAVVTRAGALLAAQFPQLDIHLYHGYGLHDASIVQQINTRRPDILLVGMGMPRQEAWLTAHLEALDVGVALQAGATLDYYAGAQAQPPRWMSRAGMAWLYRLAHDPQRLWRRYLLEPWQLLVPTLRQWYRHRHES